MAEQSSKARHLDEFLRRNDAHVHSHVYIAENESSGIHFRASQHMVAGSTIVAVPHSLALSYLNAIVDESWPVFRQQKHRFKIEAIGFFYLMVQYIHRDSSFWKPYLDSLPGPALEHKQPLFFEDPVDVAWLRGSDVWHTNLAREEVYRQYYESGIEVLGAAGIDTELCTWHLFKWAASIFTSRSFSSRALHPQDSKYWTAYKYSKGGRKQVVLMDMSHTPAEDLDFPVLFPGMDIGNHDHNAKIDYIFDTGRSAIKANDDSRANDEVFNNYGPKGNDELLLGYGFCIPDNPHDTVAMTLKAPPKELQAHLRTVHPGYFDSYGVWSIEQATVKLARPGVSSELIDVFQHLPEPLLELLTYILQFERGLPFIFIERPLQYLAGTDGRRYLPYIARMIVQSLAPKLGKLQLIELPNEPGNARQRQAAIYRNGQAEILTSLIAAFRAYTGSLILRRPDAPLEGPVLARLEVFLAQLRNHGQISQQFMDGIEANTNTRDMEQLMLAGWEEDVWVLLLCYLIISSNDRELPWLPAYIRLQNEHLDSIDHDTQADGLMVVVRTAAQACPESIWSNERWHPAFVAEVGKMLQYDSFMVMCQRPHGEDEARLCVYLHHI